MKTESEKDQIRMEFSEIREVLDERSTRRWCAAKARAYNRKHGRGGVTIVFEATKISRTCIHRGIKEIEQGMKGTKNRIRKQGGGRKKNY